MVIAMNDFILDAEEKEIMDDISQYQSIMNDDEKSRFRAIADYSIKQRKLKEEAAEKLDVKQPRISDLMNNKLDLFKLLTQIAVGFP